MPVTRHVQHDWSAHAEVRPEQRALETHRDPPVHAQAERCRVGHTRERRVALAIEDERRKRGRRVDVAVPETREPGRSRGRRCRSSGASGRRWRRPRRARTREAESCPARGSKPGSRRRSYRAANTCHAMLGLDGDAKPRSLGQQRVEHRARPIGVRKQLAVFFLVQPDPELLEKRGGTRGRKRAQHVSHDARRAAPEVALGHLAIRDIAARAAADQDLRADTSRTVETSHVKMRRCPGRENRRRQAGGPAPTTTRSTGRLKAASTSVRHFTHNTRDGRRGHHTAHPLAATSSAA